MAISVCSIAPYLVGQWRITRRIRNHLTQECGQLVGTASFAPVAGEICYQETGQLALGSYRGTVSQRYRLAIEGNADAAVHFADGRFFHRLDLSTGMARVAHDCGADRYLGRYNILHPDRWSLIWMASGPRKSYLLATRYTRIGTQPARQ